MGFFSKLGGSLLGGGMGRKAGRSMGFGGGGDYPNPSNSAMPYLNRIPGIGQQYLNPWLQGGTNSASGYAEPYIQEGQSASNIANPQYNQMTQDPTEYLNKLMRGYNPSQGYRFKEQEMLRGAQNSAAQGGFSGTRNDQMMQSDLIRGLLGDDMQQFLGNVLGIQGAGLEGQEKRIGRGMQGNQLLAQGRENQQNRGLQASMGLADYLGSNLGQQAGLAQWGQQQQNQMRADKRNARNKMLMNLAGMFAGGGGM